METTQTLHINGTISLYELLKKGQSWTAYLISKWWLLLIITIIGGGSGILYSVYKPVTYTARTSFIVEEGKSGGGLVSLASQFGFDLGGLTSGGNWLFAGDNILVFLKSNSLVKETLLTPYDSTGNLSLADKYADATSLKKQWKENAKIGKDISFHVSANESFSRLQDSLLQVMITRIINEDLVVERPDKKSSFVQVTTKMQDELLAKYFCERLVKEATDRYVTSKITRQAINVARLQKRADSIGALLNRKTFATAIAQEELLDINPGFKTASVNAEVTGRDKAMLTTIYGEVIRNLEISKVALSQETPTIQVIDAVDLPLNVNRTGKLFACIVGGFVAFLIGMLGLTLFMIAKAKL